MSESGQNQIESSTSRAVWISLYLSRGYMFARWGRMASFKRPSDVLYECQKCGTCCGDTEKRTRHVLLLKLEAERISKATSTGIGSFAVRVKGREPYVFEMRKKDEDGKCIFLDGNQCTIYAMRPMICRFYPFELKTGKDGKHEFSYTEECYGIGRGKKLSRAYFEGLFRQANDRLLENSEARR